MTRAGLDLEIRIFVQRVKAGQLRDHDLLKRAVGTVSGHPADAIVIDSRCVRCGADHGKPSITSPVPAGSVRGGAAGRSWQASISRCPGIVAVAVADTVPVGVDVESVERLTRAPIDAVAFHPEERAALDRLENAAAAEARTVLWTHKEAIVKATGHGLRLDPTTLWLSIPQTGRDDGTRIRQLPPELAAEQIQLARFSVPGGRVGAVAALTKRPLSVEVVDATGV